MLQKPPPIIEEITTLQQISGIWDTRPIIGPDDVIEMIKNGDLDQLTLYASSRWDFDAVSSLAAYYGHLHIIDFCLTRNNRLHELSSTGCKNALRGMHEEVLRNLFFPEPYMRAILTDLVETMNRRGYEYIMKFEPSWVRYYLLRFETCRFPHTAVKDFIELYEMDNDNSSVYRKDIMMFLLPKGRAGRKFDREEQIIFDFLIWQSRSGIYRVNLSKPVNYVRTRLVLAYRLNLPPEINLEIAKYISHAPEYYIKQVFNSCHRIKGRGRLF
jgi:hypothetical protein